MSDEAWIEYQLTHYPLRVVLEQIGIPLSSEDRRWAAGEAVIKRALVQDRRRVIHDLVGLYQASLPRRGNPPAGTARRTFQPELSTQEWDRYVRRNYPNRVVRDLDGIRQAAAASMDERPRPRARKHRGSSPVHAAPAQDRLTRYVAHLVVAAITAGFVSSHAGPLAAVALFGLVVFIGVLLLNDGTRSAVAFRLRRRTKVESYEVSIKVRRSSWNRATAARVLKLFSIFLPPEYRADYVEEQTANILAAESNGERFNYLIDLILEVPKVAWEFYSERKRESAK